MKLMPVHVVVIVLCFVFPISTGYSLITLGMTAAETRPWTYIAGAILIGAAGIAIIAMLLLAARTKTSATEVATSDPTGPASVFAAVAAVSPAQNTSTDQTWVVVQPQQTGTHILGYWIYTGALATLVPFVWFALLGSGPFTWEVLLTWEVWSKWELWLLLIYCTVLLPLLLYKGILPTLGQLRYGRVPLRVYIDPSTKDRVFRAKMQLPRAFAGNQVSGKLVCRKLTWKKVGASKGRVRMEISGTPLWQTDHHFRVNHHGIVELLIKVPPQWPASSGSEDMEFRQGDLDKVFIAWRLEVQVEVPGIDFVRDYEVPVPTA